VEVARHVKSRSATQCRERWVNCLDPRLNFEHWNHSEDQYLVGLVEHLSFNTYNDRIPWAFVAKKLGTNRRDDTCMSRYKSIKKKEYIALKSKRKSVLNSLGANWEHRKINKLHAIKALVDFFLKLKKI